MQPKSSQDQIKMMPQPSQSKKSRTHAVLQTWKIIHYKVNNKSTNQTQQNYKPQFN